MTIQASPFPTLLGPPHVHSDLAALEQEIEAYEAAYARDLGALMRMLAATEFQRDGARAALAAYQEARDRAAVEYADVERALRRTQGGLGAAYGERVPAYLAVVERTRGEAAAARLADANARLDPVRARAADLDAELAVLAERLTTLRVERDPRLSTLRERRRQALRAATTGEAPRESPRTQPLPPAQPLPVTGQPTEEELKAIRERIRRDEWDDLPSFHGSGDLPQRACLHCGAPVDPEHRRFCSRECHEMHLNAYGSPTRPRQRRTT